MYVQDVMKKKVVTCREKDSLKKCADLMRDWKKFIHDKGLDWVNVGLTPTVFTEARKDPRQFIPKYTTIESLNYADTYDVFSTPKLFVVDGERKFIGKSLSADQIEDLVKKLKERKAKKG